MCGGGGGGALIFSYMRRLGSFGGEGSKFGISIFFGVFRKMNIFGGLKILWILLGSSQNLTIFRGHFYAFQGLFLWSRYRMGDIFWGLLKFQIIFGCLKFLIFSWVNGRCWTRAYIRRKNESTPPPPALSPKSFVIVGVIGI